MGVFRASKGANSFSLRSQLVTPGEVRLDSYSMAVIHVPFPFLTFPPSSSVFVIALGEGSRRCIICSVDSWFAFMVAERQTCKIFALLLGRRIVKNDQLTGHSP